VQFPQSRDDIVPDASRIWNALIGPDPYAFVDPAPEMLGELSEDLAADDRTCLVRLDTENQGVLRMHHARDTQQGAPREPENSRIQHADLLESAFNLVSYVNMRRDMVFTSFISENCVIALSKADW